MSGAPPPLSLLNSVLPGLLAADRPQFERSPARTRIGRLRRGQQWHVRWRVQRFAQEFCHAPDMVGQAGFYHRRPLQGLMDPAKVVEGDMQRDCGPVRRQLLAERIGASGVAAEVHPCGQVSPFEVNCGCYVRNGKNAVSHSESAADQ